jgi:hypothetical protein
VQFDARRSGQRLLRSRSHRLQTTLVSSTWKIRYVPASPRTIKHDLTCVRRGRAGPLKLTNLRETTNPRGSDADNPTRHANPDRRTHTRAVPHRPDTPQPPPGVALEPQVDEQQRSRKRRDPAPRRPQAVLPGARPRQVVLPSVRRCELPARNLNVRYNRQPALARQTPEQCIPLGWAALLSYRYPARI